MPAWISSDTVEFRFRPTGDEMPSSLSKLLLKDAREFSYADITAFKKVLKT